ncbi:MAG TPA: phenylalanine--tRNA ligase subunit alpha [Spirochaetaceae bacterium]|nr:phenylalanine--tRNA ligase subunit alpha [Spirochaetaceae bacterium]
MIEVRNLHPLEIKLLLSFSEGEKFDNEEIENRCAFNPGHANQAVSWTLSKNLISRESSETLVNYEISEKGRLALTRGLIARRIVSLVKERNVSIAELPSVLEEEQKDIGSDFALLKKAGVLTVSPEKTLVLLDESKMPESFGIVEELLKRGGDGPIGDGELSDVQRREMEKISKKRGSDAFFRIVERDRSVYALTADGAAANSALKKEHITGDEIGEVTKELLESGSWHGKRFREYDVEHVPVSKLLVARENPYSSFIRSIKDKLVAMGFEEFDGGLVENEFWNGDALFMPQFHPARDIHDVYYIESPSHSKRIDEPFLTNVANVHECGKGAKSKGWEYPFDRQFSLRNLLRSQGTVLSAHALTKAKVPSRYFGVVRCFRYDQVDATHGSDFYQTEGIVLGDDVNLKNLLGLLEMFAKEIAGAKEIKYVPGYFPFTEPSVEVHIKHPVLGWFELGGSGIFRKEVTTPLGIKCPVLAWGLGIDRMALMNLGLNDIRELFTGNIENVRLRRG